MASANERKELVVNSNSTGGINYFFVDFARNISKFAGSTKDYTVEEVHKFVQDEFLKTFRSASSGTLANGQYATTLRNLRGLGRMLYDQLVPEQLKELIENLQSDDHLHIISDNIDAPWELVKNGGDFWGLLFVMSRANLRSNIEPKLLKHKVNKVINMVGDGIPKSIAKSAGELFDRAQTQFGFEVVKLYGSESDSMDRFFENLPTADIVHFTCHGHIRNGDIYLQIVQDPTPAFNLMLSSIKQAEVKRDCIVFANACVSSATKSAFRQSMGFGPEFCAVGASAFIGTLDFVPDRPAVVFAENFYNQLFQGINIGQALLNTRRMDIRVEGKRIGLAQLLYSLYGNAYVTMQV